MAKSRPGTGNGSQTWRHGSVWTWSGIHTFIPALIAALIAVLCAVTYRGIFDNYLFNDDFSWLRAARYDMTWGNILTYRVVNFFRPLVNLTFFGLERISPGNLPLHYSCNLLLHFLNSLLVFRLILMLLGRRGTAAATAALFAVSSLHIGAVFWISGITTLLSTFLLLASLIIATSDMRGKALQLVLAGLLYVLALAAKETAITGLPLLILIYAVKRRRHTAYSPGRGVPVSFTAVSAAYLLIRQLVMGGFAQQNWGPGFHAARNLAGGFLFQLYPFPVLTLLRPQAASIAEPTHPFLPEIVVPAVIALLIWIGAASRRPVAFALAIGWSLIALLPSCAFRYRFFSTASITQNRYYYLSSVGTLLIVVLLLSLLWNGRSLISRTACSVIFVILVAGWIVRVHRLERKWEDFTGWYREIVTAIVEETEARSQFTTIAIENPPLSFPYVTDAILVEVGMRRRARGETGPFERPHYRIVQSRGGSAAAERFKPCIYISYTGSYPKKMQIETLE